MPSYDPDPKRRRKSKKGKVPPQLRAWVYRGRRKRSPIRHFSGRIRTYDPDVSRRGRIRGRAKDIGGKIAKSIDKLGSLLGFGAILGGGMYAGYKKYGTWDAYTAAVKHEWQLLFKTEGNWNPLTYLGYKFCGYNPDTKNYESTIWMYPFWGSLATKVVCSLNVLPSRLNAVLKKLASGAFYSSIIGALVLPGTPDFAKEGSTPAPTGQSIAQDKKIWGE